MQIPSVWGAPVEADWYAGIALVVVGKGFEACLISAPVTFQL